MTTFQDIRAILLRLLPTLALVMAGTASTMFCALVLVPQIQRYETATHQLEEAQATLAASGNEQDDILTILASQLDKAQMDLQAAGAAFFTEDQVDGLLDHLYQAAAESAVLITTLQSQQPPVVTTPALYDVKTFRLQVSGTMPNLLHFLTQIQLAAAPSFILQNISIGRGETDDMLRFDIHIYLSHYADGSVLAALTPLPLPTHIPTSVVPTLVVASPTVVVSGTPAATASTHNADDECVGALPPIFKVGDIVIVDFDEGGALNILATPRTTSGAIETRALAYNNNYLEILAGPVCGIWNNKPIWYWHIDRDGIQGWVAEGLAEDRWLCPLINPECA